MLGLPRNDARRKDEITQDLLDNIPVVNGHQAETTFAIEGEDVILAPPGPASPEPAATVAQQLRYDLGEAFARELDRAEQAIAGSLAAVEKRLADAEAALMRAHEEAQRERAARESAEARLQAFKELALK